MPFWQVFFCFFCLITAVWSYMVFRNISSIAAESCLWAEVLMRWECQKCNIWWKSLSWITVMQYMMKILCHKGAMCCFQCLCSSESLCVCRHRGESREDSSAVTTNLKLFPMKLLKSWTFQVRNLSPIRESSNLIITLSAKLFQRIHWVFLFFSYVSSTLVLAYVSCFIYSLSPQHLNLSHNCRLLSSLCVFLSLTYVLLHFYN